MLGAMRDTKTHRPRTMNKELIRRLLLPYQARWVNDRAGLKVIEKARRVGISWTEAYDAVMHAGGDGGGNVYYQAYNLEMTRGFIEDCASWAQALQIKRRRRLGRDPDRGGREGRPRLPNRLSFEARNPRHDVRAPRLPLQGPARRPRHRRRSGVRRRSRRGAQGGAGLPRLGRTGACHQHPQRRGQPLRRALPQPARRRAARLDPPRHPEAGAGAGPLPLHLGGAGATLVRPGRGGMGSRLEGGIRQPFGRGARLHPRRRRGCLARVGGDPRLRGSGRRRLRRLHGRCRHRRRGRGAAARPLGRRSARAGGRRALAARSGGPPGHPLQPAAGDRGRPCRALPPGCASPWTRPAWARPWWSSCRKTSAGPSSRACS